MPDYYALLGVTPKASTTEITKAYHRLVARYHPDKHQDNELRDLAEEKIAALNEAYETLADPRKRALYDETRSSRTTETQESYSGGAEPRTIPVFPLTRTLLLLAILGFSYGAMRFVRNPRILALIGLIVALIWFGPRIVKLLKK